MSRLRPRANSPAGKSFRELCDRFLAGVGAVPSPLQRELAERAAWAGTHLAVIDRKIAEGHALSAAEAGQYEALTRSLAAVLREMRDHDLRPALGPLHGAGAEAAA